jgi:DNA-directed RNA polymerase subunit RPC12/RpoP
MSIQTCPKCGAREFTWAVANPNRVVQWHCSPCDYAATEDEAKRIDCQHCGSKVLKLLLTDEKSSYYFCLDCGKIDSA